MLFGPIGMCNEPHTGAIPLGIACFAPSSQTSRGPILGHRGGLFFPHLVISLLHLLVLAVIYTGILVDLRRISRTSYHACCMRFSAGGLPHRQKQEIHGTGFAFTLTSNQKVVVWSTKYLTSFVARNLACVHFYGLYLR